MRNAGFGKSFNYGQNVEKRDLPVKQDGGYGQNVKNRDLPVKRDGRLRAKREELRFARKMSLQTKRTSAIIVPVFGAGTFSLRFAVFSVLMRLAKKDDDCRITFVFCLTWLTFVAYHGFYV